MADYGSQPGTSAGSGNINTYISRSHIGILNQHNYPTASTSSTHAPRRNPINNIELAVDTFIGRVTELNDIMQRFQQYPVVVLAAMGGMGKTQLARKFASVNANVYRDRYWINAETDEQLLKSFDRLAEKVNVKANTDIDTVRDTYRSFTDGAALLIFDNVEHVNNVYKYLPTRIQLEGITLHVLVTSRWTEWTSDSSVNCYQLQPFDISVSLQLFQRKFSQICIDTMQKEWIKLAGMLGYLPLALQVATSYIHKRNKHNPDLRTVLADYMKQLREGADGLLNDPLTEYDNRSVYTSMLLTLKQLENKTDAKWKFAVTVINAAAYIEPDRIDTQRLLKLLRKADNTCILDEALAILTEYSLFHQFVNRLGNTCYSVHRIIQTSIRHNQTVMGTADIYYIDALKYAGTNRYYNFSWEVIQFANERASAVVDYYLDNPSSTILKYLVKHNAITAVRAVFEVMTRNQIQSQIQQHNLLYCAVESGDLSMTQSLCRIGADINQLCEDDGESPLHLALRRGNIEIATWLLENGAAPSIRNWYGGTALHVAAKAANHKMISIITKTDSLTVNATDNNGETPLLTIEYSNNEEDFLLTIRALVKSGADITAVDKWGNTVLHSVAGNACAAAVSLILKLKKDLSNIVNKNGDTALHVIPYGNISIDDERILSTIRVLFESGVDLTKVDVEGNTVLHSVARNTHAAAVSLIHQLNKDLINIVNEEGQTALHVITYDNILIGDLRILSTVRVLIESGVDLTKVDVEGNTVLHTAVRCACAEVVSLILKRKKDLINIVNKYGQTALHRIPYCNKYIDDVHILETIRVLIESGLDLTKVDVEGNTVLHSAACYARAKAVSLILKRNKDLINIVNEEGQTALHILGSKIDEYDEDGYDKYIYKAFKETARVLIMNDISLDTKDKEERTPLDTVQPKFKDILLQVADECNNQLLMSPEKRQRTE